MLTSEYKKDNGQGDGTLAEAAWNELRQLTGAPLRPGPGGAMAMARVGQQLLLVFGPADKENESSLHISNAVYYAVGRFRESR